MIARLARKADPVRRRAESDLRRFSIARCRGAGLASMLRRNMRADMAYLNVGHENLNPRVFDAVRAAAGRSTVLIHDTIPLDYPQFQRPGSPERFAEKLRVTGEQADLVIYNSQETRKTAERYFLANGRVPAGIVAHLGMVAPCPDTAALPPGYDFSRPYFVTVGTIEPRKNHALLLDIWAEFHKGGAQNVPNLFIVGRRGWNNRGVFERLDSEPFMGKTVFELSGLSDPGLFALLDGAAGLLFPSMAEGFGLPLIEAAALGVPVICADLPVYREFLENFPVYLSANDRYLWKQEIGRLVGQMQGSAMRKPVKVPTWADHFNTVLKVT
jgi:glycosyltransferase involved in cell wall biosynthesis